MKHLALCILVLTSLPTLATTYSVTNCDYEHQKEVDSTVADMLLANNSFFESNYVLRSAVSVTSAKENWQKVGAALMYVSKEDTVLTGFHLCTKDSGGSASLQENFQLDEDLKISELVSKGEVTLDLDHSVYMGDEHLAAPGSTLNAKVSSVNGKDHLVEVVVKLTLNICDLTLQTEEEAEADSDCNKVHDKISGTFKMTFPKKMSLK